MTNTNTLTLASALSDHDLLDRLATLAGKERETSAELVAHLAALDERPSLYAARGHGSLFGYCTRELRLSEDAASNRIEAARACQRFPVMLDLLASGALSLSTIRLLRPHLTSDNHESVLAKASGRSRQDVLHLIAELAPRPDVPSSVRKLPAAVPAAATHTPASMVPPAPALVASEEPAGILTPPPARRPIIEPTSPERYRVQFTIGKDTHDKLRRLQDLLRREIPDGDPAALFDRAVTLLLEKVEKVKIGAAAKPRPIRPGTDKTASRHIPNHSKRVAWEGDGGQCGFVASNGQRCHERAFLEFHHIEPYALGGSATPENIGLRCRRHNQYEAERVFGRRVGPGRDDRLRPLRTDGSSRMDDGLRTDRLG
jgi:hypothetical protein